MTAFMSALAIEEAAWVVLFDLAAVALLGLAISGRIKGRHRLRKQPVQQDTVTLIPTRIIPPPREWWED